MATGIELLRQVSLRTTNLKSAHLIDKASRTAAAAAAAASAAGLQSSPAYLGQARLANLMIYCVLCDLFYAF